MGINTKALNVNTACHSDYMSPAAHPYLQALECYSANGVPLFLSVEMGAVENWQHNGL
jgi:hypothetical protein